MIRETLRPHFKLWCGEFVDQDGETCVFYAYYPEGSASLAPSWSIRMFL